MIMSQLKLYIQENLHISSSQIAESEHNLLLCLESLEPNEPMQSEHFYDSIFGGAYLFIPDGGQTYQNLIQSNAVYLNSRDLSSSHDSLDPQYSFMGNVVGECLIGTREIEGEKGSWIQLEGYPVNFLQNPAHMASFVVYVVTGLNTGPHGTSAYTEASPLVVHQTTQSNEDNLNIIKISDVFNDCENNEIAQFSMSNPSVERQMLESMQNNSEEPIAAISLLEVMPPMLAPHIEL